MSRNLAESIPSDSPTPPDYSSSSNPPSMARAPESPDSPGSHNSPNRPPVELGRSQSANRGGCWTCRLRRKKCDEIRENDSCQTCIRLKIKCLGWGPRRPDWMRDKQLVEAYKADIKRQLTAAGLIRGQPRTPSLMQTVPSTPTVASQGSYGFPDAPGPSTQATTRPSPSTLDFRYAPQPNQTMQPGPSIIQQTAPYADLGALDLNHIGGYMGPQSASAPSTSMNPSTSHYDAFQHLDTGDYQFDLHPAQPAQPNILNALASPSSLQREWVLYYFEHVRMMQYVFAGNAVTNIIHSFVVQEPQGAVTNAICALGSLHYSRIGSSQHAEGGADGSTAEYFYNQALLQISNSKQVHGRYGEADAVAILHLISFSLFSGGTTEWQGLLAMACEWLAEQGITVDENPKLALQHSSAATRLEHCV